MLPLNQSCFGAMSDVNAQPLGFRTEPLVELEYPTHCATHVELFINVVANPGAVPQDQLGNFLVQTGAGKAFSFQRPVPMPVGELRVAFVTACRGLRILWESGQVAGTENARFEVMAAAAPYTAPGPAWACWDEWGARTFVRQGDGAYLAAELLDRRGQYT